MSLSFPKAPKGSFYCHRTQLYSRALLSLPSQQGKEVTFLSPMAELHYGRFSGYPFLYSPVSSAFLQRLWDGHLPLISASDFIFSNKLASVWAGMLTFIPHPIAQFVTSVNTWKRSKLREDSASRIWLLAAAFCPTTPSRKRSGRSTPRTLTHSVSRCGLVRNKNTPKHSHLPPPPCEAICMPDLPWFRGSLVTKGKRRLPTAQVSRLSFALREQGAWGSKERAVTLTK